VIYRNCFVTFGCYNINNLAKARVGVKKVKGRKRLPGGKAALITGPLFPENVETGETISRFRAVSEAGCHLFGCEAKRNQEL